MDPISVVGLVESSLGLALQLGSAAKALNDFAGKYKNAKLTIKSLTQNLDILQIAWTQIGEWVQRLAEEEGLHDDSLSKRVEGFLETGKLVMEALQLDLQAYDVDHLSFLRRSRLIWNENSLQGHQSRIREQALSMSLFLQAVNLPTPQARAKQLQESETQFQKSDQSAYSIDSIVPSRMSVSASQRDSYASGQSQDIVEYRRLSFEKRLFVSKVYLRSSKNAMIKELSKARTGFKRKDTATATDQTVTDWEPIRDQLEVDSLLAASFDVSISDNETTKSHTYSVGRPKFLMENSAVSVVGLTSKEEFIRACEHGDSLQVKNLLECGLDLHTQFKEAGYSGLKGIHVAAIHGHINVIETLLGCGAIIEEEDASEMWRPLHFAAKSGQGSMAKFLIQKGAQIDAKDRYGIQPIHEASRSGSTEVLEALIEAGAAVDCSDRLGCQPLHWATMVPNHSDAIMYQSQKGTDVEIKASDGSKPPRMACTSDPMNLGPPVALEARTNYEDGSQSVLATSIKCGSKWALEILLKHGADPNHQNDKGQTVLHILAQFGDTANLEISDRIEICRLLLNNGADVNLVDNGGDRVLHCLAVLFSEGITDTVGIEKLAKLFLDQGADIDATNKLGLTPLYLAIQGDNRQLSKLLLRYGARKLKRTIEVRAEVQVTTLLNSQTPRYTVNIWRGFNDLVQKWTLSTRSFELSIDDEGYFDMVCVALGDDRASRTRERPR